MRYLPTLTMLALLASGVTFSAGRDVQTSTVEKSSGTAENTANRVQHITLPEQPGEVPKGPNVEVYEQNCLACHSARYVTMQPGFPRSIWEAEVKKMIDAYGAPISEADRNKIVDYLIAVRGVPEDKGARSAH